jgi:hypothetical protein
MPFLAGTSIAAVVIACKSAPTADVTRQTAASSAASVTASLPVPEPSASAATPSALPHLKPVSARPYPDGPIDEVLCAAIHSQETDLWERFGHFIPLFQDGVIWVGEGDDKDRKATEAAMATYVPKLFLPDGRACSKGGILFYQDRLADGYTDGRGNPYFIAKLETAAHKANPEVTGKTMAQRFVIQGKLGWETLLRLCAADAQLCERALRVHPKSTLCGTVLAEAETRFAYGDRSWSKSPEPKLDSKRLLAICNTWPAEEKICVMRTPNDSPARTACWRELASRLGY